MESGCNVKSSGTNEDMQCICLHRKWKLNYSFLWQHTFRQISLSDLLLCVSSFLTLFLSPFLSFLCWHFSACFAGKYAANFAATWNLILNTRHSHVADIFLLEIAIIIRIQFANWVRAPFLNWFQIIICHHYSCLKNKITKESTKTWTSGNNCKFMGCTFARNDLILWSPHDSNVKNFNLINSIWVDTPVFPIGYKLAASASIVFFFRILRCILRFAKLKLMDDRW